MVWKKIKSAYFSKKRVLVMGLGLHGGGVETVKFLARAGAKITVTDLRSKKELKPSLRALAGLKNIRYVLGRHRRGDFLNTDLIVKNPGVKPDSPYLRAARKNGIPVTSDMGIFFRMCPARIIGITGTRGKSTTAYLIWKMLKTKMPHVFLGGNIRKPVLQFLPRLKKSGWVVLELSSFQLQDLAEEKISPQIAVFTNVFRDHLNWHKSFTDYVKAKSYIFRFQRPGDRLFINPGDEIIKKISQTAPSQVVGARLPKNLVSVVDQNLGKHYRPSVALAVAAAKYLRVPDKKIMAVLETFRGLEGRQKEVAHARGVHFINDTTATIPEATVEAIRRFRPYAGKKKLILIAGGQDKKLDFRGLAREIKRSVDVLVFLPGTATKKIKNQNLPSRQIHGLRPSEAKQLASDSKIKNNSLEIHDAASMQEAVKTAWRLARKGDYVILSPGAASFGLFLNEFDRGERFVKAVNTLLKYINARRSR